MIRTIALVTMLVGANPNMAAPIVDSVVEPTLLQCLVAATTRNPNSENGPLITDCVSIGSNACQNLPGGSSSAGVVQCDGQELAFWEALMAFELITLRGTLKSEALASMTASQKAWVPWRAARCDFAKKSEKDATLVGVDVSYCMMETTALRAIDLLTAL